MRKLLFVGILGGILGVMASASSGQAAIVYLQNFSASAGMTPLSAVNWNPYYGSATTPATAAGTTGGSASALISGGPSAPSPGANVNATQAPGVTGDVNGFVPVLSMNGENQFVVYTSEYAINRSVYTPTSFSWYAASGYTGDLQRLIVQIGGSWYASTSPVSPPSGVIQGTSFAAGSAQFSTPFSTAASAWETLNFSPRSNLTLGSPLTSPLPDGNITGFGIYAQIADSPSNTNERTFFDTYEVDAVTAIIPEPSLGIAVLFAAAILHLRRRSPV